VKRGGVGTEADQKRLDADLAGRVVEAERAKDRDPRAAVALEPRLARDPAGEDIGLGGCQLGLVMRATVLTLALPSGLPAGVVQLITAMVSAWGAPPNRHDG